MSKERMEALKARARKLKNEITAVYYAYGNARTPRGPKIVIALTLFLALSPIDLIPDFIPVLGYLDDLIIIPFLLAWSIRLIPPEVMEESRRKAEEKPLKLSLKSLRKKFRSDPDASDTRTSTEP
ncbi:MAG: YkvA family protein [Spirochaetales bacterium]|nr:YkvA family protein [Spirochaetales bacterium]